MVFITVQAIAHIQITDLLSHVTNSQIGDKDCWLNSGSKIWERLYRCTNSYHLYFR
jgi:hypothetical protein